MPLTNDGSSPKPIGMGSKRAGSYYNNFLNDKQNKKLKGVKPGIKRQRMRARMLKRGGIDLKKQKRLRRDVRQGEFSDYGMAPTHPGAAPGGPAAAAAEIQNSLPEFEILDFENQRANARNDIGRQLAQTGFERGLLALQRTRQIEDVTRNFADRRATFDGGFAGRGLLRSGIRNRAHRLHGENRGRAFGDIDFEFEGADGRFALGEQNLNDQLSDILARIDVEQQTRSGQYLSDLSPQENPYA